MKSMVREGEGSDEIRDELESDGGGEIQQRKIWGMDESEHSNPEEHSDDEERKHLRGEMKKKGKDGKEYLLISLFSPTNAVLPLGHDGCSLQQTDRD